MTTLDPVSIIGRDHLGLIAQVGDGERAIRYYLTECCRASATGVQQTADNPAGVACRGCYRPIDPRLGGLPPQPDGSAGDTALQQAVKALRMEHRVDVALRRVNSAFPPGSPVEEKDTGLWLVANTEPGADPWHRHAVVFDNYPLTRATTGTGWMRRWPGEPLPVGVLHRGSGRAGGFLTDTLPAGAFDAARAIAHQLLPEVPHGT